MQTNTQSLSVAAASCFAGKYAEARQNFKKACDYAGVASIPFPHPLNGPDGISLSTDVAEIGAESPKRLLILNSGIHGVEGFSGSAALVDWLTRGAAKNVPTDTRVVLIHALNPFGFAWLTRVNEDNVDINRNFVTDFSTVKENNPYQRIHCQLFPEYSEQHETIDLDRAAIEKLLDKMIRKYGKLSMQSAVCTGQYQYPGGIFYGGRDSTWSRNIFTKIVTKNLNNVTTAFLVDFHTGLGPYGVPELIARTPLGELESGFRDSVTSALTGNAIGPKLAGSIGQGIFELAGGSTVYSLTAEFGTYGIKRVLSSLILDNWHTGRRGRISDPCDPVKMEIKECFCPDDIRWKTRVLERSRFIIEDALTALARA